MKYAVLGTGAMGLRIGVLMQEAGIDVDFVDTWEPQLAAIKEQGGVYVSRDGKDRHLVPLTVTSPEEYEGSPDAYIVFMKQMQLADMLARCAHFFKEGQYAVSGMNGMGHVEKLDQYFAKDKVIVGTALIATVLKEAGDVDFIGAAGLESMHFCNQTEQQDNGTDAIMADFEKATIHATLTTNFMGTLAQKLVLNSVINSICTLFEIKMGEYIAFEGADKLGKQLVNEAFDVFEAAGIKTLDTREESWEGIRLSAAVTNPLHYPSMYQDFSKNRPTEVDFINGYIYDLGQKVGVDAKTHDFLRNLVHLAETTRKNRTEK